MEGDLNLSQALGGLRIANQTDDSPPPSPRDTGASNNFQSPSIHIPDLQQLSPQITESYSPHTPGALCQTPPLGPSSQLRQSAAYPPPTPPSRPTSQYLAASYTSGPSTIYHPQGVSSSGSVSSVNPLVYPDYARISREPSRSSLSGPSMGANRQSQRERSNTDRSYRQSGPTGPYPPRGSSRGMAQSGSEGLAGAGLYALENGPPNSSEEWKERGAAVGVQREIDANGNTITRVVKKGVKDFSFGRTLGEGSYSTVFLFYYIVIVCIPNYGNVF